MSETVRMMSGNEAIARGAYEAGVTFSAAYPGTPSTEISENIVQYKEIYCEWSVNEKVALEAAVGASILGSRALVSMKHVGLNVASDPLYTSTYIGANGGLVLVVADDPGVYSSQNEQDTRCIAKAAGIPFLEPADSQEAKDYTKLAFVLSETYDTPVIVRTTARVAHSVSKVALQERQEVPEKMYQKNITKHVMIPASARIRHKVLEERLRQLEKYANTIAIHTESGTDTRIGFLTSGICYQYIREVFPNAAVLKLGMVYPLPMETIETFSQKVDILYVVEELEPVIEEQVRARGIACHGKDIFTRQGEYSSAMLLAAIQKQENEDEIAAQPETGDIPARPPILCAGCPHRSIYMVLKKLGLHVAGDIGCYTLGAMQPIGVIDSVLCMGASISMLHGMEKAKGREYTKDWVAVIGDSTFMHTGINALMNMVYNRGTGTVIIMDNETTAMTGHQVHAASKKTLMGEPAHAISIEALCRGVGVREFYAVDAFDRKRLEELVIAAKQKEEVTVICASAPCVLLRNAKQKNTEPLHILTERCFRCGKCLRTGCPALGREKNRTIFIDPASCNGCGLCADFCDRGAIV